MKQRRRWRPTRTFTTLLVAALGIAALIMPSHEAKAETTYGRKLAPWQRCLRTSGINKALVEQGRNPDWETNIVLCKESVRLETETLKASLSLVALAHAYEGKNQLDTAVSLYQEAIRLTPVLDLDLHFSLAKLYRKKGLSSEAVTIYKKIIRLHPDSPKAHFQLAKTYLEEGRRDEAFASYQEAVRSQPDLAEAHLGLGEAYERRGEWDEALVSYHKALRLKSDLSLAYYGLGRVYGQKGRLDDAITAYRQALRLNHSLAEAHYDLGETYAQKGQMDAGIAAYQEAVHLKPDFVEAHYSLGVAYAIEKRRALADDYLYQAAELYLEAGNREGALKAYGYLRNLQSPLADRVYDKLYP